MQHSKSLACFGPTTEHIENSPQARVQRRSSLDTFVIPGRTRLPSSKANIKPDVFDMKITQGLLNSSLAHPPKSTRPSDESGDGWQPAGKSTHPRSRAVSRPSPTAQSKVRGHTLRRPPPRFNGQEVIIVSPRRQRPDNCHTPPKPQRPLSSVEHINTHTYDGANDLGHDSRFTSRSWSTVSHRVFTDSSGGSRIMGAEHSLVKYNRLALKYGLPQLPPIPNDDESQTKVTTKFHHHWLSRKLFRRSSSTYTLNAKTTYKPVIRKKSFGGIPSFSDDKHKNILKGKSLEETSRLGGLGIITLPPEFAIDKLTLPTCLSATASYLFLNGHNAPGIFRVSGQTSTVNALYEYYDHQFSHAGSPSKVEETVGSGLLPSHIEFTVSDVASLFKRILIDLPGGLLGSVELFEALRGIMLDLQCEPELSESDKSSLKAKLIALAVSSVSSDYRSYLIQAVMGLVAYLGHEAEKARDETLSTTAQQQPGQPSSELMSCKSLGVVLGPLLLGSMTDNTNYGANEVQVNARPPSTESAKKFGKKHKRKKSDKDPKLDQNAALSALVDRANLTASVMQSLLLIWPDVVKQLREINSTTGSASQLGTPNQVKKISSQALSRLTMKTSEEDVVFLDILRGRTLPDEFRGAVHMTRKVRISSRSPISRGSIKVSDDDSTNRTWLPTASEQIGDARSGDRGAVGSAEQDIGHPVDIGPLFSNARRVPTVEQYGALDSRKRTPSDVAVDHMSMGTILPLLQNSPISSEHTRLLPRVSPVRTPPYKSISRSTSESPETAVKDVSRAERSGTSDAIFFMSNDKPLPPIGDAQRAELSAPPTSDDDSDVPLAISSSRSQSRQGAEKARFPITQSGQWTPTNQPDESNPFPPRQSSLPLEKHLPMRPIETYESLADYKARSNSHLSPPKPKCSRESSSMYSTQEEAPVVPYQSGVKFLAQRFAEASRLKRNGDGQAKDNTTPRVYTYVRSLSSPISSDPDDPFISPSSNSAEREKASLIPKPVQEVGRGRRAESRSPSPPKRAAPTVFRHKRSSMFHIIPDRDADIVQKNTVLGPPVATTNNKRNAAPSRDSGQTSSYLLDKTLTRSLSTYSAESLRRLGTSHEEEDIPVAPHVAERTISFARSDSPLRSDSPSHSDSHHLSDVPARTNSFLSASDALKPLERRGSMNTTLYNEICRLQRLLKQKGEEVQTTRRSLDAVRDSKECATVAAERSRSKGTLSDEVREARKELGVWRRRAEWAERRLAGMGDLAATAGDDKSQKVKIVGPRTRGGEDCERERVELDRGRRMERGPGERERGARGSCRDDHGSCDLDSDF